MLRLAKRATPDLLVGKDEFKVGSLLVVGLEGPDPLEACILLEQFKDFLEIRKVIGRHM